MGRVDAMRWNWPRLTKLQIGKYAGYYVKTEFTQRGFDVYTAEVDDNGIDFVTRREPDRYYDVQVKSSRGFNYIFFQKSQFDFERTCSPLSSSSTTGSGETCTSFRPPSGAAPMPSWSAETTRGRRAGQSGGSISP